MTNPDSLIQVLQDSIKTLNSEPQSFWQFLSIQDTNLVIFVGSFLAIFFSILFQLYLVSRNYKNAYYEKIIQKRLNAYTELQQVLKHMKTSFFDVSDSNKTYPKVFASSKEYYQFMSDLMQIFGSVYYIDVNTFERVRTFHRYIRDIRNEHKAITDQEFIKLGKLIYPEFNRHHDLIHISMYNDFSKLHKVAKFLRNKKKTYSKPDAEPL